MNFYKNKGINFHDILDHILNYVYLKKSVEYAMNFQFLAKSNLLLKISYFALIFPSSLFRSQQTSFKIHR